MSLKNMVYPCFRIDAPACWLHVEIPENALQRHAAVGTPGKPALRGNAAESGMEMNSCR